MNRMWRDDIVDAVVTVCGLDADQLVDGADLETLSIDSLDLIEVAMIIEERYDVEIQGEDFVGVETFGGAVGVFHELISGKLAGA